MSLDKRQNGKCRTIRVRFCSDDYESLAAKEADAWAQEMSRIVTGTIHELVSAADRHNIDRDSAVQYFSDLFSVMASVSTFEHFTEGGENNEIQ